MFKRIFSILIIAVITLSCVLYTTVNKSNWQRLYINAVLSGDIIKTGAKEIMLTDINFDGTPELVVKYNSYAYVCYIVKGKIKEQYINSTSIELYKNTATGRLLWINTSTTNYKYGYTRCIEQISFNSNSPITYNIFSFNNDVRGGLNVYYQYKGILISKQDYFKNLILFWKTLKRVDLNIPHLHIKKLDYSNIVNFIKH